MLKQYSDAVRSLEKLLVVDSRNSAARKELEAVRALVAEFGGGRVSSQAQKDTAAAASASTAAGAREMRQLKIEEVDNDSEEEEELAKKVCSAWLLLVKSSRFSSSPFSLSLFLSFLPSLVLAFFPSLFSLFPFLFLALLN